MTVILIGLPPTYGHTVGSFENLHMHERQYLQAEEIPLLPPTNGHTIGSWISPCYSFLSNCFMVWPIFLSCLDGKHNPPPVRTLSKNFLPYSTRWGHERETNRPGSTKIKNKPKLMTSLCAYTSIQTSTYVNKMVLYSLSTL